MPKPRNLFYGFQGSLERGFLTSVIKDMDEIAEMPIQENMDLEKMSRLIEFRGTPRRFLVRDIQMGNPNGKNEVDYTAYFEDDGTIKRREGLQYN